MCRHDNRFTVALCAVYTEIIVSKCRHFIFAIIKQAMKSYIIAITICCNYKLCCVNKVMK